MYGALRLQHEKDMLKDALKLFIYSLCKHLVFLTAYLV